MLKTRDFDHQSTEYLFKGERYLIITGVLGFVLAAGIAIYLCFHDPIILPEGNVRNAFSFNAAIGIFILSIAAILPFAGLRNQNRKLMRRLLITASLYSYGVETIQNFRGLNPRFSQYGTVSDSISGMLFALVSLLLIILTCLMMLQFFRIKPPFERPLLILGIRYAFLSVFIANLAGIWMILLQGRYTGDAGNIIILHGISFHALQTLVLLGWLLDRVQGKTTMKKVLLHSGSIAWMLSIIIIGIHTAFGHSVFELTLLPILTGILLLIWLAAMIIAFMLFLGETRTSPLQVNQKIIQK
ncbi:membrane protein [Bacillus sp. SA1-12]|uniref:hypothetical protein n=1 Tax=Bacillus sp. SA1-12 TaxID=1455638 RepID=UPI0006260AB9|nr:hypothetical protein [Bacillus sp. SA1-12]KKI94074.1 membrane protein [Bacillus sp. SA1-12]